MSRLRQVPSVCFIALLPGCVAIDYSPIPPRLAPEHQASVEAGWERLLAAQSDGEARQLTLDSILLARLHRDGVDRLRLISEKYVGGQTVVMETSFDRMADKPDTFAVTVLDTNGNPTFRAVYTPDDVKEAADTYFTRDDPAQESETEEQYAARLARFEQRRVRLERVVNLFPELFPEHTTDEGKTYRLSPWGPLAETGVEEP